MARDNNLHQFRKTPTYSEELTKRTNPMIFALKYLD